MVCSHNGIPPDNEKGHSTMTCNIVDESQNSMLHKRRHTPRRTYRRFPFIQSTKRGIASLWCLKAAWGTWVAVSGRSTRGASQGLGRFCSLIWVLVTQMVQF